jgi:hypothetical protein
MRADANALQPFRQHFSMDILAQGLSKWDAKDYEGKLINQHKATGPAGYNTAKGHPASTKQFWYLRRRGIL